MSRCVRSRETGLRLRGSSCGATWPTPATPDGDPHLPAKPTHPCQQRGRETDTLEQTNERYAIAKIAELELGKICRLQYGIGCLPLMPTNLYGSGDIFHMRTPRALPALLAEGDQANAENASIVEPRGTGTPRQEFLHVDGMVGAVVFNTRHYTDDEGFSVSCGEDIPIGELGVTITALASWERELVFNDDVSVGISRKLVGIARLVQFGGTAPIELLDGLTDTCLRYLHAVAQSMST